VAGGLQVRERRLVRGQEAYQHVLGAFRLQQVPQDRRVDRAAAQTVDDRNRRRASRCEHAFDLAGLLWQELEAEFPVVVAGTVGEDRSGNRERCERVGATLRVFE
jgi:hypothetical protein